MSTPGDDPGDLKDSPRDFLGRVRVSIACQHCRTRKIKCDGEIPCKKCAEAGIICQPGAKRKKRAPSRKDQYIRELEKKLQDLQSLRNSPHPGQESTEPIDEDDSEHDAQDRQDRPAVSASSLYKQGTKQMSEYQYFGASSAFTSIEADAFGSRARSETQHTGFGKEMDVDEGENPGFIGYYATDNDLETGLQAVQAQLPPSETVQIYVDAYFSHSSIRCPLLNEADFRARVHALVRERDHVMPPESFLSTFLMVLCLGEYVSSGDGSTDDVRLVPGWRFFLSAYSSVREGLRRANIESMQAVTLQVLYLQAISKLSVAYILLGSLIRLMQAAGMHRAQELNTPEGMARTHLMNMVYTLEKQLALGLGRPSLIQDFDCDFHTPSPPAADGPTMPATYFATSVHLARIAGQIHRSLYSPEAGRSSTQAYLQSIERCEAELERWRTAYMPSFPRGGQFARDAEIPVDTLGCDSDRGIPPVYMSYMHLLCSVRRAVPVFHALDDGSRVLGMDQQGVDTAIAMIRLSHADKAPLDPISWLAIYKGFTAAAILHQSLKAKATLRTQVSLGTNVTSGVQLQVNALRIQERLFLYRVRGYTGAAHYFAQVIRGWIDQFEEAFDLPRSKVAVATHHEQEGYFGASYQTPSGAQQRSSSAAMALGMARAESFGSYSPPALQQYSRFLTPQAAPLPSPSAPAAAAFSALYTQDPLTLGLTTATSDFQGAYNWMPSGQYAAYGYGPDPPSAVADNTDFSGSEMFEMAGGYGNFEVRDLMMPAWMPGPATTVSATPVMTTSM